MKILIAVLALACSSFIHAENKTEISPLSMRQLMDELRVRGGNFKFSFDEPVYARVSYKIASFLEAKDFKTGTFTSDKASKLISLFYVDSPERIGDYPKHDRNNNYRMLFNLS